MSSVVPVLLILSSSDKYNLCYNSILYSGLETEHGEYLSI